MLVAARAVRRASEHQVRLSALLDAAKSAQLADSPDILLDEPGGPCRRVLRSSRAVIARSRPPRPQEIGIRHGRDDGRWLVCAPRSAQPYDRADRRALTALAAMAEESLGPAADGHRDGHPGHQRPADRARQPHRVPSAHRGRRSSNVAPGAHVAVLFCDLDDFKPVNDRFGHEGGDAVLLTMAKRAVALRAGR